MSGRLVPALNGMTSASLLALSRSWPADPQLVLPGVQNRFARRLPVWSSATTVTTNSGHTSVVQRSARSALIIFRGSRWYASNAGSESAIAACRTGCENTHNVVLACKGTLGDERAKVAMPVSGMSSRYACIVASRDQRFL
jgi:hypothetical protein